MNQPRVVSLGGGHGLAATLKAMRELTSELTAIVTVADNGGSSGRLRDEFSFLPPGDLRMALAALCSDDEWGRGWAEVLQYRFTTEGSLNGHPLGNLLLMALWDKDGDPVAGVDRVGKLLRVVGRVLPMSLQPLDIEGTFNTAYGRTIVRGQVEVATAKGRVESLRLIPENPESTKEAIDAIAQAEWITFGPGSWFSSVMPHVLLQEQARAIAQSSAKKIMIFNLPEPEAADEFAGSSLEEHLRFLLQHFPDSGAGLEIDYAIADRAAIALDSELQAMVEGLGGKLIVADVAEAPGSYHHSVEKLRSVFTHIMGGTLLR
jgi:uncharacterized cofD-like protein